MSSSVLVVEDDATLRMVVVEALCALPVEVFSCSSAELALNVLEHTERIDLIVADVRMPGRMSGLDLASIVWSRWPGLPIVLTSGYPLPNTRPIPHHSAFIAKPWTLENLLDAVQARLP